jgi:hypothetical protein
MCFLPNYAHHYTRNHLFLPTLYRTLNLPGVELELIRTQLAMKNLSDVLKKCSDDPQGDPPPFSSSCHPMNEPSLPHVTDIPSMFYQLVKRLNCTVVYIFFI